MSINFSNINPSEFWSNCDYATETYIDEPVSQELINSIEEELGYKLPLSYIQLMKTQNGGIPINTSAPCAKPTSWADDHIAISGIFGIGRKKRYSLGGTQGNQFWMDEWEYPPIGVYICDCPSAGHDMICLDYRKNGNTGEPEVVHVDQENEYKVTFLASSFEEFIQSLVHDSVYDE